MKVSAECWIRPDVEIRVSAIAGQGLFALTELRAGELVGRLGGVVVDEEELRRRLTLRATDPAAPYLDAVSLDGNSHLILPRETPVRFGNHSCNPNLWWDRGLRLVARCDVEAGKELTNDYATSTALPDFRMSCRCGSSNCRGVITGEDWKLETLREAYGEHWTPALLERLRTAH
jgi:SET domain-containing protein